MTRFARAKGSKSSNEKKPEEATSWSEMKKSILAKKANQTEGKQIDKPKEVKVEPSRTEWASLGDDNFSQSLLKPDKKNKNSTKSDVGKLKKKKKVSDNLENSTPESEESNVKKKIKKRKVPETEEDGKKKAKKRKLTENGVESEKVVNNKKQLTQTKNWNSNFKKNYKNPKGGKKFEKMKKNMKSNNFRKENSNSGVEELIINGEKIKIVKFQGFYVTLEDAERLKKLRSEMIKGGIPKAKLEAAIKLERRRAEKALSRLKKSVCFHCRGHGHLLSSCPNLVEKENTGTGICYKCGSTEHSASECKVVKGTNFKFAECFICKEQGHIARQCPDNPRGLYPQGGACRECGDVTHLRKDCPQVLAQKSEEVVTVGVRNDRNLECLDEEIASRERQSVEKKVKKKSTVKF